MKYLLKKFTRSRHRQEFPEIPEKFHCNPREFQKEGVVGFVLMREEKAFSDKKFLQVAPNCAALKSLTMMLLGDGYLYLMVLN